MTSRITRMPRLLRLAAAGAVVALGACADDPEVFEPEPTANAGMFDSYVALGNSLTAGWQSGGINDSTQRQSYAYLLATQAFETRYAYASLLNPGCPPPVNNFQTQAREGTGSTGATCLLRDPASVTEVLNNVGVPDAFAVDPTAATSASSNALTTFILGGRTQVQRALMADPTFLSLWIGNNDVLIGATTGLIAPSTVPGLGSPGITAVADYTTRFNATVDALVAGAPDAEGVLVGVVNVTNIPLLFPVQALFNAQFKGGFDQFAGTPTTIHPSCTPTTTALVSFRLAGAIRAGFPAVIACAKNAVPGTLVGDAFVLDGAELATLAQTVAGYNAAIQARATALGWAYFDPNPALAAQRASGQVPQVPNIASPTAPFGPLFSLDGVHPSRAGHVLIANGIVAAINAKYGTSLPTVQ